MSEERSLPTVAQHPAGVQVGSWLAPFLFSVAILGEILSFLLMTIYRYQGQHLTPEFFDLTKTANLLGFLFELPFVLLFLMLLLMKRHHTLSLASTAAVMACIGLVALSSAPMLGYAEGGLPYLGYAIFLFLKALELGIFFVVFRAPWFPWWRKSLGALLFTVLLALGSFIAVIALVLVGPVSSTTIVEQPRQEFDAGVILGAAVWSGDRPSPVLRERISKGYDLLKQGTVQFLVLTGGSAPNELPEAEVGRRELLKRGVDPTRIVLETHTSSTLEQIIFIRDQLQKKQGWSSFIIISDQFHLKRALEICQFNDIDARGVSSESPLGPQNLAFSHFRESAALVLYWLFGV